MELDRKYLALAGTVSLSVAAASTIFTEMALAPLLGAVFILSAYSLIEYVSRVSRREGRTKKFRASLAFTKLFFELAVLSSLLMLPIIPKFLAVTVLAALAITEIFSLKLVDELRSKYQLGVGWEGRIMAITASFAGYYFNEDIAFLGVILILGITIYNLTGLGVQLYRNLEQ